MKKKKMFISFMALVVLFAFAQMAMAYTVTTGNNFGPYQTGSGGEFTLMPGGGLEGVLNYYSDVAKNKGYDSSFQTFCVETGEYIDINTTYNTSIDSGAIKGGAAGGNPDPLSKGTAYLYYQFATGNLANYNYGGTVDQRKGTAATLQEAIWVLENEAGDNLLNPFLNVVLGWYGGIRASQLAAARGDNNDGFYNVGVLNLTLDGVDKQSQLVVTPIPAAVWLLGSGLVGLVVIRRRMKK